MATQRNHIRLYQELQEMCKNPEENITAGPVDKNDLNYWEATLFGPKDTPYENGIFLIKINLPVNYPFAPPKVVFETKIFHCNIKDGEICLDILKNEWSPALTISKVLLSISSLLSDPNADDPLDNHAANLYRNNRDKYNQIAKDHTKKYASDDFYL